MPDDCIVSYELEGKFEETGRDEIYDLYSRTSHLRDLVNHGADGEEGILFEYEHASEDLSSSNQTNDVVGADFYLFS